MGAARGCRGSVGSRGRHDGPPGCPEVLSWWPLRAEPSWLPRLPSAWPPSCWGHSRWGRCGLPWPRSTGTWQDTEELGQSGTPRLCGRASLSWYGLSAPRPMRPYVSGPWGLLREPSSGMQGVQSPGDTQVCRPTTSYRQAKWLPSAWFPRHPEFLIPGCPRHGSEHTARLPRFPWGRRDGSAGPAAPRKARRA